MRGTTKSGLIILVLFALSFISGCTKTETVKIGLMVDLTNKSTQMGIQARDSALLFVEAFNALNEELNIELIVKDTGGRSDVARQVVEAFIDESVYFIVGPMTSVETTEIMDHMVSGKVLFLSPTVATDSLLNKDDYFIRVIGAGGMQGSRLGLAAVDLSEDQVLGIVYEDSNISFTGPIMESFIKVVEISGAKIDLKKGYDQNKQSEFYEVTKTLAESSPDGVLFLGNSSDTGTFLQQLKLAGYSGHLYLSLWSNTPELIPIAGASVEGAYMIDVMNDSIFSDKSLAYQDRYVQRYNIKPSFAAYFTDETLDILIQGLLGAPTYLPEDVKNTILSMNSFEGYSSIFSINEFGDSSRRYELVEIRNGAMNQVIEND